MPRGPATDSATRAGTHKTVERFALVDVYEVGIQLMEMPVQSVIGGNRGRRVLEFTFQLISVARLEFSVDVADDAVRWRWESLHSVTGR